MFLFALLLLDNLIVLNGIKQHECQGVIFFNHYYTREKLFGSLNQPMNLAIHKYTNELFFSYIDWNSTDPGFRIRVCNLYKKTCNDINKVLDGHAVAYDRITRGVYFGGKEGIFKYDRKTKSATKISKQPKVWRIFVQRNFYIIRNKVLYVFNKNGSFVIVPEVKGIQIQDFFVSKGISIYFSNETGLYKVDRPGRPIYLLSNKIKVTQITEDYENGGVFFSASDGIYMDHIFQRKVRKVADIKRAFGIAFWNPDPKKKRRQLIYSTNHAIFMLKPSNHSKLCLEMKMNKSYSTSKKLYITEPTEPSFTLDDKSDNFLKFYCLFFL